MIIEKKYCDESGAFYICNQKFRYNNKIKERLTDYLQSGGAILWLKDLLPVNKIFEEFSLKDYRCWCELSRKINAIGHDLKACRIWHAEVVFGNCSDDIQIDKLGWLIRYDSETMSEAEFYGIIVELFYKYGYEYSMINMPTLSNCSDVLIDNIVGVRCHWGMGSHYMAHCSYESILSNFYN